MSTFQPANECYLLHTDTRYRKLVGVAVQVLGKIKGKINDATDFKICGINGNWADMVFSAFSKVDDGSGTLNKNGVELNPRFTFGDRSYAEWTEQRRVHLPSLKVGGNANIWDLCPSCKKATQYPHKIVKKGDLTVSLEKCEACHPGFLGRRFPHIRHGWGKEPILLPESVDDMTSNNEYVVFYFRAPYTEEIEIHNFYMLKWSDLEKGIFTSMGVPVPLPKEAMTSFYNMWGFLLNRHDQLCALWGDGSLILGGRFYKIEAAMGFLNATGPSMLELKSRTTRYVVARHLYKEDDNRANRVTAIALIDGRAKVLSGLVVKDDFVNYIHMSLLGSSTLIISLYRSLSVVAVKKDKLKLIAGEVPVFKGEPLALHFIAGSNNGERLLMYNGRDSQIASVKLRYF